MQGRAPAGAEDRERGGAGEGDEWEQAVHDHTYEQGQERDREHTQQEEHEEQAEQELESERVLERA